MARENSKRAGWLCMPHPSSIDGCCMAIKTYGRHNLWKTTGLARSGRPSSTKTEKLCTNETLYSVPMIQFHWKARVCIFKASVSEW